MRGNATVDYAQTGLDFCLYECEVWFNHGLCQVHLGHTAASLKSFMNAHMQKRLVRHDMIDAAVDVAGKNFMPFAPPDLKVYRPKRMPNFGGGSLLHALSLDSITGLHTPAPSNSIGETQSRKVVAVVEGELVSTPFDFGTNKPMARKASRFSAVARPDKAPSAPDRLLIKLRHHEKNRYMRCSRGTTAEELLDRIREKLRVAKCRVKYCDANGDWLALIDTDDLGIALEATDGNLALLCL